MSESERGMEKGTEGRPTDGLMGRQCAVSQTTMQLFLFLTGPGFLHLKPPAHANAGKLQCGSSFDQALAKDRKVYTQL